MSNQIPARSLGEFFIFTLKSFQEHECQQSAAALTYATLFAFVPLLTVIYKMLSIFPGSEASGDLLNEFVFKHMLPESASQVLSQLQTFSNQAGQLTIVGLIILFLTAILMIKKIERTFNKIWNVEEPRRGVISIMLYWSVLSIGTMLLGLGLAISSFLASATLFGSSTDSLSLQSHTLAVFPFITGALAFALMYSAVPNCYVPFKSALAGGIVAAMLFESAKKIFALFAASFSSYEFIYGAFAAVPLFLLWVYLSWNIVLFGVEWVRCLVVFKPKELQKDHHPLLTLLQIIHFCWQKQRCGELVSQEALRDFLYTLPNADWGELRQLLMKNNILQRTETGDFAVVADLHSLSIYELLNMTPWTILQLRDLAHYKSNNEWEQNLIDKWQEVDNTFNKEFSMSINDLIEFSIENAG